MWFEATEFCSGLLSSTRQSVIKEEVLGNLTDFSEIKFLVIALGKQFRPAEALAKDEKNLEWVPEERDNEYPSWCWKQWQHWGLKSVSLRLYKIMLRFQMIITLKYQKQSELNEEHMEI